MKKAFNLIVLVVVTGLLIVLMTLTACSNEPGPASVLIDNQSGAIVEEVYISLTTEIEWGSNLLGGDSIPNGESKLFSGITPGVYDILVILDVALMIDRYDIDLSAGETYTWVLPPIPE